MNVQGQQIDIAELFGEKTQAEKAYEDFVNKFKPKKTTDDCYTPDGVYDAIADWVAEEYGEKRENFVRPFWPGADYQATRYEEGCVVVDNPPFSILSAIVRWYMRKGIKFFLFAPRLTMLGAGRDCCSVIVDGDITYENGAEVSTSFITNLDCARVRSAPDLEKRIREANKRERLAKTQDKPRYAYPNELLTASMVARLSHYGINFLVMPWECHRVAELDAQKQHGKSIFGSGYLLSEKAAAEKAAAEKAGATIWTLSERERAICMHLGLHEEG